MAAPRLSVYLNERFLGLLEARPPALAFTYDQAYLASPDARPLSLSLPLTKEPFEPEAARAFFAGLLPEGQERERIARHHRLSTTDEFGLLRALGEDCAGAVVILPEGEKPPKHADWEYRAISEEELEGVLRRPPVAGFDARGRGRTRLSLAGAQAKVALYRDGAGRLMEPRNGAPSNTIIKPDLGRFPGVARLEAFCMTLAQTVGLPVPATEILVCGQTEACLIERYDRAEGPDGFPRRLHQEDFCQAMGLPPEAKYEEQGRVSLAACFELIDRSVARPAQARRELLKWVVFNFLIGNADAHVKNLSLLHGNQAILLAPFYDLVSTDVYARRYGYQGADELTSDLALGIGGKTEPEEIRRPDWQAFAEENRLGFRIVQRTIVDIAAASVGEARRLGREERFRGGQPRRLRNLIELRVQQLQEDFAIPVEVAPEPMTAPPGWAF